MRGVATRDLLAMTENTILERVQNAFDWVPKDIVSDIFVTCVKFMYFVCGLTGISYEALNIWLFIIIQPALILAFFPCGYARGQDDGEIHSERDRSHSFTDKSWGFLNGLIRLKDSAFDHQLVRRGMKPKALKRGN